MKVKAVDMQYLKYVSSFSKRNTSEIDQVIKLFQERKIERFDTARSIIDNLSSGGKKKQKAGLDKLEFYNKEYISRQEQYIKKATPTPSNSYNVARGKTKK